MQAKRDIQLDMYRGLTMIYIVCWIHVIYGKYYDYDFIPPLKSFFLFEMPAIFFISGAAARLARPKGEKEVMKNRFKRVYVPYFKYAFFSIIVFWTYEYFHYHIFPLSSFKQIVWGILGIELPGVYHSYHLWFILPYFIISILPKQHLNSHRGGVALASNVLLVIMFEILENQFQEILDFRLYSVFKEVLVYNIFYLVGFLFYKRVTKKQIRLLIFASLVLFLCLTPFYGHNMQANKFPPNLYFLAYGICTLSILSLFFSYVRVPNNPVVSVYNKYGYGIYLYQGYFWYVWVIASGIAKKCLNVSLPFIPVMVVYIAFIFSCGYLFGRLSANKYFHKLFL